MKKNLKKYHSFDQIISDDPREQVKHTHGVYQFCYTLRDIPSHILTLKVGAIVILIINMNCSAVLVNCVCLIVTRLFEKCGKLKILTGTRK